MTSKLIVGSDEWCSLPGIGIPAIKARLDSGAATSALHAFNIVPFQREGIDWISFEVHPIQSDRSVLVRHDAEVLERRGVRNTTGMSETRCVIREELVLEVNSSSGLEGIETATGKDLAGSMIQDIERKLGWVRPLVQAQPAS